MFEKYTKAQKWIFITTIVLFILFLIPAIIKFRRPKIVVDESSDAKRIELLEFKVKKFEGEKLMFDSTLKVITDSIVSLQYEIEKKEMQILNLKKKKNETNIVVRNFNDSDITNFFANRYK